MVASLFNTAFTSLTLFGPAFIFYLNDLGLDKARIGMLLSLVPFAGIVAPLAATAVGRFGLKRTFVVFWGLRKAAFALIFLVPFILHNLGTDAAFLWVAGLVLAFSVCRALAETGFYPWLVDLIPNKIRGQLGAASSIVATLISLVTAAAASYVVDHSTGIERFTVLFAVGLVCGLIAVGSYAMLPGGGPVRSDAREPGRTGEMRAALADRNFTRYLLILALISLGGSIGSTFVALYANEQIGLTTGSVVLLSIGSSIGALLSSYPLGWASDRYGSRPMMVLGLAGSLIVPLGWLLMPRHTAYGLTLAMSLAFFGALAGTAWNTGAGRYLYVNAVQPDKKTGYMAVWYAFNAIVGGSGPLIAGWLLHLLANLNSNVLGMTIDAYTPLFLFNVFTLVTGVFIANRMRDDEALPLRTVFTLIWRRGRLNLPSRATAVQATARRL